MKTITTEEQAYVQLARRGDPSAFYALFHGQIRGLYVLHRARGADHAAACAASSSASSRAYRKFIGRGVGGNPRRWFAAASGLGRFDAAAANVSVTGAEEAECGRNVTAALNKAYSDRLDKGSDGKGNFTNERPFLPYVVATAATVCATAFLFFSQSVLSISFERFGGKVHRLSFPAIAESLWDMSGLVRAADVDLEYRRDETESARQQPAAAGEETAVGDE